MDKYIFFPKLDFDLNKINQIVNRNLNKTVAGYATHQRLVQDEPYLVSLKEKYLFFSDLYNIYSTPPGYITPIHICPERGCALNIPISYTENSHTIFYEIKEDTKLTYVKDRIYDTIREEDTVEVFRYTLDRPTLMNTKLPHGVIGGPLKYRIIMSWSIRLEYDYETVKKILLK